jgi:hypothetical protein
MAVATATSSSVVAPQKAEGPAIRKDLSEEAHGLNAAKPTPPTGNQPPSA